MSVNMLKRRLDAGKACVNAWLAIPSGFSAEVMAQCGWDSVTVDMQHGVQDYHSMIACFQAISAASTAAWEVTSSSWAVCTCASDGTRVLAG